MAILHDANVPVKDMNVPRISKGAQASFPFSLKICKWSKPEVMQIHAGSESVVHRIYGCNELDSWNAGRVGGMVCYEIKGVSEFDSGSTDTIWIYPKDYKHSLSAARKVTMELLLGVALLKHPIWGQVLVQGGTLPSSTA